MLGYCQLDIHFGVVVLRMYTVVSEERDHEVVAEGQKVHRVAKEIRHPVVTRNERHEEELQHVQEDPERQEGTDGYLEIESARVCVGKVVEGSVHRSSSQTRVLLRHWWVGQRGPASVCQGLVRQGST